MSSLTSVPVWIYVWFIVSGLAQLFDFAFLLLRPRSLTGGDLAHLFSLHNEIYLAADPQFADAKNRAAIAQGWINCIELAIALFALFALSGARRFGVLAIVSAAGLAKTVFYFASTDVYDYSSPEFWKGVGAPVAAWVVVPPLVIRTCLNRIDAMIHSNIKSKNQ
jgi:hypothetical protein